MIKRSIFVITICFIVTVPAAHATAPRTLSLVKAMEMARDRSLESVVADERVKQAVAKKGQALSVVLPQVSLETYQKRQTRDLKAQGIPYTANTDPLIGPFNSFDARLKVSQMLVDIAAVQRLFTVDTIKRLSEAEYRKAQQDVMALAASMYTDAMRAQDRVSIVRAVEGRERKRLWIAHRYWRTGRISLTELKQVKVKAKEAYASYLNATRVAKEKMSDLQVTLGFRDDEAILLASERPGDEMDAEETVFADPDLSGHPDIEIKKLTLEQKQHERDIFFAEYWPKISTVADYGLTGADPADSQDTYTVGIQGNWSLVDGGQRGHKVEEGKSAERSAQAILLDAEKRLRTKAQSAYDLMNETRAWLSARDLDAVSANQKLTNVSARYQSGLASQWDYLNERVETLLVEDERAEAAAAYLLAKVNFYHSVGKMDDLLKNKVTL